MPADDRIGKQPWSRITAQLTAFAYNRTRRRSWELAQDLASEAIAQLHADPQSWNRDAEPLLKHLAKRVIGLASNEYRRKRNSFEVAMDVVPDTEIDEAAGDPEDLLDRRRLAESFRERLTQRLSGDEAATAVMAMLLDGIDTANDQAKSAGLTMAQVREARRRVFYHAAQTSNELAREIDDVDDEAEEVAQ